MDVRSRLKRIIVVRSSLENQTLKGVAFLDVEELGLKCVIVAHLIAGDVIKLPPVDIAVVAMLVAVTRGLHPKRTICVKKFDVRNFITKPFAISNVVSTYRNDRNGMDIRTQEIRVGGNETGALLGGTSSSGSNATARTTVVCVMSIGPAYNALVSVGVEPSSV